MEVVEEERQSVNWDNKRRLRDSKVIGAQCESVSTACVTARELIVHLCYSPITPSKVLCYSVKH